MSGSLHSYPNNLTKYIKDNLNTITGELLRKGYKLLFIIIIKIIVYQASLYTPFLLVFNIPRR